MPANQKYVMMLESDADDRYFTESTLAELGLDLSIRFMMYGPELFAPGFPEPSLVLVAYNTYPDVAIDILRSFKQHPAFSHIPVVILCEELTAIHIREYYQAGANSVVVKPSSVESTRHKVKNFFTYWFEVAEL